MIAAVCGTLADKSVDRVLITTAGGVSYEVAVPLGVLERLPAAGEQVELMTALIVRDDGWALYGFDRAEERTIFKRLLGVNGVGPRLALAIVSTLGGNRVVRVLKEGDTAALCTVPGVGKKTADRIALELKGKLSDIGTAEIAGAPALPAEQAVLALINLGYGGAEAERAVRAAAADSAAGGPADLIRAALQLLARRK